MVASRRTTMSECKIAADLKDASYYCMILVVILMFDLI
jgi:hypothetical protein